MYDHMYDYTFAVLRLFKAVPDIGTSSKKNFTNALHYGIYITPEAFEKNEHTAGAINDIINMYGYDIFNINAGAMHTFKEAHEANVVDLFVDQILNYMSTYGVEALGGDSSEYVYIPAKELNLQEDAEPVKVTVISCLSADEIKKRCIDMLTSGAALKGITQDDIMTVMKQLSNKKEMSQLVGSFKNKEFKIRVYKEFGLVPKNPDEWLRYVVYSLTGSSMIVKNDETYTQIRSVASYTDMNKFFDMADLSRLAEIFHRNKLIFLAMKSNKTAAKYVNRIRKLADKYHKPMKAKALDTLTSNVNFNDLENELKKVTTFKKVSAANAILYRKAAPDAIAYFIRNGKVFVEEFTGTEASDDALETILASITEDVKKNVEGKSIYLPEKIAYAMPTSEKKFWGHIPFNSCMQLKKDVVIGVHWEDQHGRTDLDFSLTSNKYNISWHTQFNKVNNTMRKNGFIIFSGDMTSAPSPAGATEACYVSKNVLADELIMANLNNYTDNGEINFKFIIDSPCKEILDKEYLIDSHTMNCCLANSIPTRSMFLGFLDISQPEKKFYFTSSSMSNSIISRYDEKSKLMLSAMRAQLETCLKLEDILKRAGAKFEKDEGADWDINLDFNNVTKDTFLSLLG